MTRTEPVVLMQVITKVTIVTVGMGCDCRGSLREGYSKSKIAN